MPNPNNTMNKLKKYGLIGYPLSNNFSVNYYTNLFTQLQLQGYIYQNYPLLDLSTLKDLVRNEELCGFNVTIPHKQTVIDLLDDCSDDAKAIGAINCVKVNRLANTISLKGYNTDTYGFKMSLMPLLKPWHQQALVLGSGGASKAVQYVLSKLGMRCTVVSRNEIYGILYEQLDKATIRSHQLIIQTTPVGMHPQDTQVLPFPFQWITNKHLVVDLIYLPEQTVFLQQCANKGAITKNGLEMLHLQAKRSWEIWSQTNE
jgi:shikimate dehydrogenase